MKIVNKISLSFLFVSLILVSIFLSVFYFVVKFDLQNFIHNNLVAVASSRAGNVETYLDMLTTSVGQLSKSTELYDFLEIDNKESPQRHKAFELSMKMLRITKESNPSVYEFLLLDKSGKTAVSSNEKNVGMDNSTDSFFLGGKEGLFIKGVYCSPPQKTPLMATAAPIMNRWTGKLIGVLVAKVKMDDLNDIVLHKAGMGRSGEVYIVNKYGYMITPSTFKKDVVFKQRVDTENISKPHSGKVEPASVFANYMDSKVLRTTVQVPRMQWTVVAEIGANEALWPLVRIRRVFLEMLFLVPLVAWLLGIFIARTITRPLYKLQKGTTVIGEGNLDYSVGTEARDEIGHLSRAFDTMTKNLKLTTTSVDKLNKDVLERMAAENKAQKWAQQLEKNIGELKRTQNMLIQSEKMASLGALVSEIAHEINNPLMIISGNAQLSLIHEPLDAEIKNNMKIVVEECQRAKGIIDRVLRLAKPSKGKMKEIEINKSIENVALLLEKTFKLAKVEIKRNYFKDPIIIPLDEQHIHEVFMNILNNAKDAMPEGGTITITTSMEENFLRIDFKDTGIGMSEEAKKKVFEPFFTTKEKGTGLGLSICYGIIKAHNGEIMFESELNKGAVFTIMLPMKNRGSI